MSPYHGKASSYASQKSVRGKYSMLDRLFFIMLYDMHKEGGGAHFLGGPQGSSALGGVLGRFLTPSQELLLPFSLSISFGGAMIKRPRQAKES